MTDFDTRAVHAGRQDLRKLGVHAPPIDLSTTYPITGLEEARDSIDQMMEGKEPDENPIYARLHNPTTSRFEKGLAELEGAEAAVAFGSGMAAMSAALLGARERGGHIVAVRPLYGGTDSLLSSGLLGVEATFAEADAVAEAIGPNTALVVVETPANPTLDLVDIEAVVAQAGQVPVLVDSTFATPVLQNPLAHGAAMVLHSCTKFIGGHGDVIAGVIATSESHAQQLRMVRSLTGGVLHPRAAYDLHRGLQTLSIRVKKAQEGANLLARRLVEHRAVNKVHYPGFSGCDPKGLVGRQMKGPGSMLAFDLAGGLEAAIEVIKGVELITPAVSLGSTDTLIQHPAGLTHRKVDAEVRRQLGITDGLMRLSVGIEDAEDLWDELCSILDQLG
jgi:methionine-gamma-lyase